MVESGLSKFAADEETAKRMHSTAASAYPTFEQFDAKTFTRALGAAELLIGAALVLPVVPSRVAGLGLGGFAGGLMGLYLKTPGMTKPGSIRPTEAGMGQAKDVWLLGIALSLLIDRGRRPRKRKS
jgi:hypothetical protein